MFIYFFFDLTDRFWAGGWAEPLNNGNPLLLVSNPVVKVTLIDDAVGLEFGSLQRAGLHHLHDGAQSFGPKPGSQFLLQGVNLPGRPFIQRLTVI